jgi:hypothetical protein
MYRFCNEVQLHIKDDVYQVFFELSVDKRLVYLGFTRQMHHNFENIDPSLSRDKLRYTCIRLC